MTDTEKDRITQNWERMQARAKEIIRHLTVTLQTSISSLLGGNLKAVLKLLCGFRRKARNATVCQLYRQRCGSTWINGEVHKTRTNIDNTAIVLSGHKYSTNASGNVSVKQINILSQIIFKF